MGVLTSQILVGCSRGLVDVVAISESMHIEPFSVASASLAMDPCARRACFAFFCFQSTSAGSH